MRAILYEHNTLNGFRFVLAEFVFMALVALSLGAATWHHGDRLWAVGWLGMAVNAAAVCGTVIEQMRRGERSNTWAETYGHQGRAKLRREHPQLGAHTLQIVVAVLAPFLLALLTLLDQPSKPGGR